MRSYSKQAQLYPQGQRPPGGQLPEAWLPDERMSEEWVSEAWSAEAGSEEAWLEEWLEEEWLEEEWLEEIEENTPALPESEQWFEEDVYWQDDSRENWHPPDMVTVILVVCLVMGGMIAGLFQLSSIGAAEKIPGTPIAGQMVGRSSLYVADPFTVVAPYELYELTQGLHGQSYGHLAIDLAAGRGEPVRSPINGFVTNVYVDEYGNTTLVVENEVYIVTMLHGDYTVTITDPVTAGQIVGSEANNGYTMDYFGNLCYGRVYCGNHTHLNIYDKRIQANVSPLDLIREP